jgi:hypothetical protein
MKKNKLLIYVAGIGVGSLLLYKLYQNLKNRNIYTGGGGSYTPPTGGGGETETTSLNSQEQLNKMSKDLFDAMDGCGTNNDLIYETLGKVKSQQDWLNLIRTYGNQTLVGHWYCGSMDFTGGLIESIREEMGGLGDTEVPKCNDILRSKGVTTLI